MHLALLGDSTFDNAAYTDGGPDVAAHLERLLGEGHRVTLLAVDGAMLDDVSRQLRGLRELREAGEPPTHVALSVGGNDLLNRIDVLGAPARSVGEALLVLREAALDFGREYRAALDEVLQAGLPTVTCTVYAGAFEDATEAAVIETALRVFDHEILEAGAERGLAVVDLRRVCSSPEDYWNPIEPGERGGAKIAAAVVEAARGV